MATATHARSARASRRLLRLFPRAPFRLDLTAWALRRQERNEIDRWDGQTYRRALVIGRQTVAVAVRQSGRGDAPQLDVAVTGRALAPTTQQEVRAALTSLLGLEVDLSGFYKRAADDSVLAPLAARYRGLKPPRFPTLFECLLNAVACQQLSLAAGLSMLSRLAAASRSPVGRLHPFPTPRDVLRLSSGDLRRLGFSRRKAQTIRELAQAADDGELEFERFEPLDDEEVVRRLVAHPGIGRWSAEYVLLRGLGRLHVFPTSDVAAINGLRSLLAASGLPDDPAGALARWRRDAGVLYFHLLARGLQQRGMLDSGSPVRDHASGKQPVQRSAASTAARSRPTQKRRCD
jgi:DNA-3-methyladenine glycosylase II